MENALHGKHGAVEFEGTATGVSWSPRRRKLPVGGGSTVSKLMRREIGGLNGRPPPRPDTVFCAEKFRRFKLQEEFPFHAGLEVLPRMTTLIEYIIPANDFIFVIDWYGYCVAFHRTANTTIAPYEKGGRIWYFNNSRKMVALFYNKINDSIITVCTSTSMAGYKMRALPLESIRRCDDLGSGISVFGSWTNKMPLFDSCNNLVVITLYQDEQNIVNNIYETKNYQLVHSIPRRIRSITTRPGIMIVAYNIISDYLPIEVFSTENWIVLEEFSHPMPPRNRLQFFGLCYENLIVKENNQNTQVIDLWNHGNVTTIENSEHEGPSICYDLIANNVLLDFEDDKVVACNSRGEQVPLLQDARNDSNCSTFHTNVTTDKNFAILYSRKSTENSGKGIYNRQGKLKTFPRFDLGLITYSSASYIGTINVCGTFNGKSIVEVNPCDNLDSTAATRNDRDNNRRNDAPSRAQGVLNNVTALFYDEEHHRIYTGNNSGSIQLWST